LGRRRGEIMEETMDIIQVAQHLGQALHERAIRSLRFVLWASDSEGKWCVLPLDHPGILAAQEAMLKDDMAQEGTSLGRRYFRTIEDSEGQWRHEFLCPLRQCDNWGDFDPEYHWHLPGHAYAVGYESTPNGWTPRIAGVKFTLRDVFISQRALCLNTFTEAQTALARHVQGDWGKMCPEVVKQNEINSLSQGSLASFFPADARSLYVITNDQGETSLWTVEDFLALEDMKRGTGK